MKKISLRQDYHFDKITKRKFIFGLILGVFYAFTIYSLFYYTREILRLTTISEDYDLWELSKKEVYFYNCFFAALSLIFAQSICFSYWISGPKRYFDQSKRKKISIINDQNFFNWSFISWFSKLAILYLIFFGLALHKGYYVFSFYPKYKYLFILFIIVIYFQNWNTIRLTFKRKSVKWLLISILIITGSSLGLASLNFIDHKKLNNSILNNSPYAKYKLELPNSYTYKKIEKKSLVIDIYTTLLNKDSIDSEPIIIIDNIITSIDSFKFVLLNYIELISKYESPFLEAYLHADKNIKMKYIDLVKRELSKCNISNLSISVIPFKPMYNQKYYRLGIKSIIPNYESEIYKSIKIDDIIKNCNSIKINLTLKKSGLKINSALKNELKNIIKNKNDHILILTYNNNTSLSEYIRIKSTYTRCIEELKDEYAKTVYNKTLNELNYKQFEPIKLMYPISLFEINQDQTFR